MNKRFTFVKKLSCMRSIYGFIITLLSIPLFSQIYNPVKWTFEYEPVTPGTYDLRFIGTIDPGWYVYSQYLESDDGPIKTSIVFDDESFFSKEGLSTETGKRTEGFDQIFGMNVIKFSNQMILSQRIKISDPSLLIKGFVEYMTCDDEKCLPPAEDNFTFNLLAAPGSIDEEQKEKDDLVPTNESYFGLPKPSINAPLEKCENVTIIESSDGKSWLNIFFLGFIGGLIALLTPCVFPMIPLTVSYFTKKNQNTSSGIGQAFLYGFFILLVYLVLSIPFHLMDSINPDILNDISTNVWLNILFFVIFIFFAFSFFGFYELTLPSSWTNKSNAAEGVGGIVGVFFMALTLALVSFSCTGPILGSLLAGALSSDGGAWQLSSGMAGFGAALALPFGLFAAFPQWMKSLPKSGGWLNNVKVVLGFLELALAFKFLSNADLVKHWGLLKIEPFLAIWGLIFIGLFLYLIGKIRFPHDDKGTKPGLFRLSLSLLSLAFAVYLFSGFKTDPGTENYKPLKLLSGLAPPVCYSIYKPCDCPQNLPCFKSLDKGLAFAKENNKPVLIDFTGHACVNCRKMEEHVWPVPTVFEKLKNDYVLISLYVDEKIELPADEQIEVNKINGGTRMLKTVGNKWSHFQTEYFKTNA
jgi:thiol:disulfide interchange protein